MTFSTWWQCYGAAAGFNLTLKVAGTNTTAQGLASEVPASSLQPVQPVYSANLSRLNLTVQVQGAGVLPFSASLQRELVSALLHVTNSHRTNVVFVMPTFLTFLSLAHNTVVMSLFAALELEAVAHIEVWHWWCYHVTHSVTCGGIM